MSEDFLPEYDPPPLPPPEWVFCFWEIALPVCFVIYFAVVIALNVW